MWICSAYNEENSNNQTLTSHQIYRFWLKVYPPSVGRVYPPSFRRACPPSVGQVYPPSLWRNVLGKSACCEEKCTPIIIRDADKALHLMPQGTLSNFCTSAPIYANVFFHCPLELFNLACPVKLSLILFNRGQQRPQSHRFPEYGDVVVILSIKGNEEETNTWRGSELVGG
jgi:hypothetical protein